MTSKEATMTTTKDGGADLHEWKTVSSMGSSYKKFDEVIQHYTIYHSKKQYVKGIMHTNTIEGFWNIVKLSIRSHVAVSKKYLPFYLISSQYIYNHRSYSGNLFEKFLKKALQHDKPMEHYKPLRNVKEIVYPKCKVKKE